MTPSITPKEKAKDARLRREFHITLAMLNKVWDLQDRRCYICRRSKGKDGKPLLIAVDHDHITGEVRGLLCWQCNKAIAVLTNQDNARDGASRAYNMHLYLEKPPFSREYGRIYTAPGRVGTKKRAKLLKKMKLNREYGAE